MDSKKGLTSHMITSVSPTDSVQTIGTDLGMLLGKHLRRCFSFLQTLNLRIVHVKLFACLAFVPGQLVDGASLEGAGLAYHHRILVDVDLTGATVQPETQDQVGCGHHLEIFVSEEKC